MREDTDTTQKEEERENERKFRVGRLKSSMQGLVLRSQARWTRTRGPSLG